MRRTAFICAAMVFSAFSARADLIVNGSFEQASVDPGTGYDTLGGGSTAITGWTVTGGSIDYIGTYWQASDGRRSLDLSGVAAGGVEQTLATMAGQTYTVLFDLAGNPDGPPTTQTVEVDAAGHVQDFTFDTTGRSEADMGWTTMSFQFTAAGGSTTLSFTSLDATDFGPALDNVRVNPAAVPEPSSLTTLVIGAISLLGYGWRRRRYITP